MSRLSLVFPIAIALGQLALVQCGKAHKEAPQEVTERAPASANVEGSAPTYSVQDRPGVIVTGRVLFNGKPPAPQKIQINQDPDLCGSQREVYPVKVDKGGIDNAVVWIDDIHQGKPFAFPKPVLDQKRCTFVPHIVLMQPGDLTTDTQDPISHNLHSYADWNRNYNESVNPLHRSLVMTFRRPERISVRCDLHKWMKAYVVVAANPYYAVTAAGGKFELDGVPPGRYHLKAWQENLGEKEQEIVVEPGKTIKVDFTFGPEATAAGAGG